MHLVGTAAEFTAFHVMHGHDGPEGELHTHDYRLEVVLGRDELDDEGMVCDLDLLREVLGRVVGTVRGENVDVIRPDGTGSVTVEVFARWAHDQFATGLAGSGIDDIAVRVYEDPVAFGGFTGPPR